ncbi:hypothetical protein QBC45DRAFT_343713 [Copromyces sp. CBS 386.78]|nr:hypothetical protein QBC45DRAFT_343713 [Copromyces sp. CBS 386.78]
MDPTRSMGSLGAIPVDNLATLAGPAVVLAVAYWYIKVHGFIYAASLAWIVVRVVKTIFAVPFSLLYWVVTSVLMIPYYLLMVILSPLAWLWHAFMAPFHWFFRFLGDPYPVIVFFTIAIVLGLCSGLVMSLTSAIASSFIHSFASSSIRPDTRKQQAPAVVPTDLNTPLTTGNNNNNNNLRDARDPRPSRTGFLNPLALHPISSPSFSQSQSRTRGYNPYDADNELVHIEYPNLSDTNTNSPIIKQQRNNIPGPSFFDQQRSPKSVSPHGPPQLHARPRSSVSVTRGLGLSAIGGIGGAAGLGVGGGSGVTLLRETIHEEEDSGFSGDSV